MDTKKLVDDLGPMQMTLTELMMHVLDRLADGSAFDQVVEETGITARVQVALAEERASQAGQDSMVVYAGYFRHESTALQIGFEVPASASKAELDSAYLAALAQQADLDYLEIGRRHCAQSPTG